jgi:hypothetical protein
MTDAADEAEFELPRLYRHHAFACYVVLKR